MDEVKAAQAADDVHVEIEQKFDVDGQLSLPRLNGVAGVAQVRYRPPVAMEALYFDTAARDLAANGVTLRRRLGGPDAGWHVKIKSGGHRLELHVPLTKADRAEHSGRDDRTEGGGGPSPSGVVPATVNVPARILDLVQVHARGRPLAPVARLNSLRSVVDLMDGRGRWLAEVCDDQVAAMSVGFRAESRVQHWREWEVELVDVTKASREGAADAAPSPAVSPETFLSAIGGVLMQAGARPAASGSKVEKVTGAVPDPLDPTAVPGLPHDPQAVLTATVRHQLKLLKGWDPLVRRDVPDSIHQFRVVCRTLRSTLQIYAPLLERQATKTVTRDLKRLGRLLATARDAEVVRDEVDGRLAELPGGAEGPVARLVPPRVTKRLRRVKAEEYEAAHRKLLKRMRTEDYYAVLDRLDAYAREVPLNPELGVENAGDAEGAGGAENAGDAVGTMEPLAAGQVETVLSLAQTAMAEEDAEERVELMHEVRKEAKRLRYAVKAVQQATGLDLGSHLVARMKTAKKLQEALGVHRDSIMFQEHVQQTSGKAGARGEDTFGYGVLWAAELPRQQEAERQAHELIAALAG